MSGAAEFVLVQGDGILSRIRADVRDWLAPALSGLLVAQPQSSPGLSRPTAGRGGVAVVQIGGERVLVRPCRRGGLPAYLVRDLYFGWRPRPFHELALTERLRRAGVPVPEVLAASVRWVIPACCYRGWVVTRFIDAPTLWQWVQGSPATVDRRAVLACLAVALRRLHAAAVVHPDLNLNNILVRVGTEPAVWLLDFDRGSPRLRMGADIERLERSVYKLDPERRYLTDDDLRFLRRAYAEAVCA